MGAGRKGRYPGPGGVGHYGGRREEREGGGEREGKGREGGRGGRGWVGGRASRSTLKLVVIVQVTSPYPLSVTRSSSPSHTRATYRLSLLPDYHCPPELPFTSLNVSFFCTLTNQEEFVSVSFMELDNMQAAFPTADTSVNPRSKAKGALTPSIPPYFPYILVTILAVILATIVICMALNKSSAHSESGFSEHLPVDTSTHPAFSPTATPLTSPQQVPVGSSFHQTPAFPQRTTPGVAPPSISQQSAYKRTNLSSSPGQHGLFSQ